MRLRCFQHRAIALLWAFSLACSGAEETPTQAASPIRAAGLEEAREVPLRDVPVLDSKAASEAPPTAPKLADPPDAAGALSVVLFEAVDANNPEDLMEAIAALEDLGGQTAIDTLGVVLQRSQDVDTKVQALDSLAFLAEEGDISSHVQQALLDQAPLVRAEAADLVAEFLLVDLLSDLRAAEAQEVDPGVREVLEDAIYELEIENESELDWAP